MKTCLNCGTQNNDSNRFCINCGAVLKTQANNEPKIIYCTSCGTPNDSDSKFCIKCGAKLKSLDTPSSAPSSTPAAADNQGAVQNLKPEVILENIWEWIKTSWVGLLLAAGGLLFTIIGGSQMATEENFLALYIIGLILLIVGIVYMDFPGYVKLILIGVSLFFLLFAFDSGAIVALSLILIAAGLIYYFWIVKPYSDRTDTSLSPYIYAAIAASIFFALCIYGLSGGGEVNGWIVVGLIICGIVAPFSIYLLYKNLKKAEKSQTDANSDDDDRDPEVLKKQLILSVVICVALILVISLGLGSYSRASTIVRNSYLPKYSTDITIGEAFDSVFTDPQWSSRTLDGKELVDFNGVLYNADGEPVKITIIFNSINGKANVFFVYENGEMLNPIYEDDFFTQIYAWAEG